MQRRSLKVVLILQSGEPETKERMMTVQRMLMHVAAIGARGGARCLAQTGSASGSSTGPGTSMGQEQGSMCQHNPGNMPNQSGEMTQGGSQSTGTSSGSTSA